MNPIWVLASLTIMLRMRGPGLGLVQAWRALQQGMRSGVQTFAKAMR